MSSDNQQKLLQEIQYLKRLIQSQSHQKGSQTSIPVKQNTSGKSSAYKWSSRSSAANLPVRPVKRPHAHVSQAGASTGPTISSSKSSTYKHSHHKERTSGGNLVYRPKNTASESAAALTVQAGKTGLKTNEKATMKPKEMPYLKSTSSKFVYHGGHSIKPCTIKPGASENKFAYHGGHSIKPGASENKFSYHGGHSIKPGASENKFSYHGGHSIKPDASQKKSRKAVPAQTHPKSLNSSAQFLLTGANAISHLNSVTSSAVKPGLTSSDKASPYSSEHSASGSSAETAQLLTLSRETVTTPIAVLSSVSQDSANSSRRKRKRSFSKSRVTHIPAKRLKPFSPGVSARKKYVWVAKSISQKYRSRGNLGVTKHLPRRSQFKWRRKSLDRAQSKATPSKTSPAVRTPRSLGVKKNPSVSSLSSMSKRKTKSFAKAPLPVTSTSTPMNTKYKWRRKLSSSSGSRKVSPVKTSTSPWIIQNRYKLTRASLLHKIPSQRKLLSFSQRRLNYLIRSSPQTFAQRQLSSKGPHSLRKKTFKSRNRVWMGNAGEASKEKPTGSVTSPSLSLSKRLVGRESKTKQGNRQWVARGVRTPTLGLRHGNQKTVTAERKSRTHMVSLGGKKFMTDSLGKRLKRLSSSTSLRESVSEDSGVSAKRILASHAVRRSKAYAWYAKQRNKHQHRQSNQYCIFFNRFGKCNKMGTCPYIHDPDKVAVCTKFLRGICDKTDGSCPFSHKISKEKMPVCSFFLRGRCTKDDCPYLHVSVGRDAEVCMDFLKGYCPRGEQCMKQHILECPEFSRSGSCPRGHTCPMRHKRRALSSRLPVEDRKSSDAMKEPLAFRKVQRKGHQGALSVSGMEESPTVILGQLEFIPLEQDAAPDFLAL